MCDDLQPAAEARHHHREAARRRLRNRQREDLIASARVLIPEHGLAVPLARIAVHAGVTRHAAAGLFNATTDLATELVRRAWLALIEAAAAPDVATPDTFVSRLIAAIRADAPAHRIHRALACGAANWQRETIEATEALLAHALGAALSELSPGTAADDAPALGRRLLALARDAALAPDLSDADAEAAAIVAFLAPHPIPAAVDGARIRQRRPSAAPRGIAARPSAAGPLSRQPELPAALPRVHDPPRRAARLSGR
jgi:hypothetical protein